MVRAETLTLADAVRYHMSAPQNPFEIAALLTLADRMQEAELRRLVEQRILPHARFCQTVAEARFPRRPRWRTERPFDVTAHIAVQREPALSPEALAERLGVARSQPLPFERSPWRMELLPLEGGQSALLFRVHHCVADGLALVRLLCELADEPRPMPPRGSAAAHAHGRTAVARGFAQRSRALWSTALELTSARADDSRELHRPCGQKAVAWSGPLDLERLNAVAEARGRHVTELLLSAAAEALARGLRATAHHVPARARALVPFGASLGRRELGNHFASAFVDLPLDEPDPWRRIARMAEQTEKLHDPSRARAARSLIGLAGWLSPPLMRRTLDHFSRRASLVLSNVPGPSQPVRLLGHAVRSIVVFAPASGSMGLSFTLFGYAGELRLSVEVDRALPLLPAALVEDFQAALQALSTSSMLA
ncbi:MAG TPA: WS/DGAT domain-containing protein [Polyangiales bacterium]